MRTKSSVALFQPLHVVAQVPVVKVPFTFHQTPRPEPKLGLVLQTLGDAIWEWDVLQKLLHGNDALYKLVGAKKGTTLSMFHCLRRVHATDFPRLKRQLQRAIHARNAYCQNKVRLKQADGSFQLVMLRTFFIYENNIPVHIIGSMLDMSEVMKLQTALTEEKRKQQLLVAETALRVQESERTRIGQELHDNVNQILATAKLLIDAIHPVSARDKQRRSKSLEYLTLAIEENRKLSRELVAPSLKQYGLEENIQRMLEDIALAGKTKFSLNYDPALRTLSADKKTMLFRVVQEQVKNILKHSDASLASIYIQLIDGKIELVIRDNGRGFSQQQLASGIGFSNMRERVQLYNGEVVISSQPGEGCELKVMIPA